MRLGYDQLLVHAASLAVLAFVATIAALFALRPLAPRLGLLDHPAGRKDHGAPTPAIGGLAIAIGLAPVALFLLPISLQLRGFAIAAFIILIAGAADDRWRIRWQYRVTAHVAAALALIYLGGIRIEHIGAVFGFRFHDLGALSVPVTIVATVGIINAINMIDGVDGLSGSVALVTLSLLAGAATYAGNVRLADALVLVIGGLLAFLVFNLRTPWRSRASVFIGNAGAEFLGLVIACASFRLTQNPLHPVGPQLAPFLVAPALVDCLVLIACRLRRGNSPFVGDRNHVHHLMLDAGFSPTAIVVTITSVTLLVGLAGALALKAHVPAPVFTCVFVIFIGAHFLWSHRREAAVARMTALRMSLEGPSPKPANANSPLSPRALQYAIGVGERAWKSLAPLEDLEDAEPELRLARVAERSDENGLRP